MTTKPSSSSRVVQAVGLLLPNDDESALLPEDDCDAPFPPRNRVVEVVVYSNCLRTGLALPRTQRMAGMGIPSSPTKATSVMLWSFKHAFNRSLVVFILDNDDDDDDDDDEIIRDDEDGLEGFFFFLERICGCGCGCRTLWTAVVRSRTRGWG